MALVESQTRVISFSQYATTHTSLHSEMQIYILHDISQELQRYIDIYLMSAGCTVVGMFAIVANIINFIVLNKQGFFKDCVSLCLLSLTFSDFCVGVFMVAYSACYALSNNGLQFYVDPFSMMYVVSWVRGMSFDLSMLTTTFISVERCLSILMPLKFKNLVTFKRAAFVLFGLYSYTFGCYSILYATHGLSQQWDPQVNRTRVLLWIANNRAQIEFFVTTLFHMVNGTVCEIVVVVSTWGMVRGLRRSAQFREAMSRTDGGQAVKEQAGGQGSRNKAIVKMILILAIIFVLCNIIRLIVLYFRRLIPDIMFGKRMHNTYNTLIGVLFFFGCLNASLNIFVYYNLKPSFKAILLSFL